MYNIVSITSEQVRKEGGRVQCMCNIVSFALSNYFCILKN